MTDPEPQPAELSPVQQARIRRLLEREFTEAWRAAVAAGAEPAVLADTIERVRGLPRAVGDDVEHVVDDPPDGGVVGEQG